MRIGGARQALALLGVVCLVGCGGGSSNAPATTTPAPTPADPAAAPGEPGEGIPVGEPGTLGQGTGTGTGQGLGSGHGRLGGSHRAKPPQIRMGATQVSGRLPPEVIQRIVRQNFGRFRLCYENGLRNNPNLQGRVSVRFVIGRDGAVSQVSNGGSDMPDSGVVSCTVRSFYGLSFPQPSGGIVTVTYPIMFAPGG